MSKPRRTSKDVEPLSPRERGRGEGSATAQTPRATEPSSGAARHLLPEGEGKAPRSSFPRKRESSDFARLSDRESFQTLNGLWKGKSGPLTRAAVIRNTNFTNDGHLDLSNVAVLDVETRQLATRTLQRHDIIIERSGGGPKQPVGRVCIFDAEGELPFSFSNFTSVIRVVDRGKWLPRHVHYYLLHLYKDGYTEGLQHATTGIRNLDFSSYLDTAVPFVPKPEQQKIAAVLWKLQRAIATQDKLLKATADLKASAMQRLFTHGLRGEPLKDTEIGPMPESWQLLPLGQVVKLERGRFMHRPRNEPRFYGGNTPFVQTGDVVRSNGRIRHYSQSLNDDGVAISKVFPRGTILITIAANIGFTGILEFDSACPDSLIGITCMEHMDAEFLNFYLQTQQADMDRLAPKGTQKNINIQFLQPWPTKVPALDEQRAIASALATLDRKLAHHRAKRTALDDLFQTLLHQLMTGAIRVDTLHIDMSEVANHFPDVGKMVGKPAATIDDQFVGANKLIRTRNPSKHKEA